MFICRRLPANRHFIEALDLKPVIMIRAHSRHAGVLCSTMLEDQPLRPDNWLNIQVPQHYPGFSAERKGDFMIDMIAPWYVSYFATWLDYAARRAGRVLFAGLR